MWLDKGKWPRYRIRSYRGSWDMPQQVDLPEITAGDRARRAAFERWAKRHGINAARREGQLVDSAARFAWDVWRAAWSVSAAYDRGPAPHANESHIILRNDDGSLDEIVGHHAFVHLEQMGDKHWWMSIKQGGRTVHVNFGSETSIAANAEDLDSAGPARPASLSGVHFPIDVPMPAGTKPPAGLDPPQPMAQAGDRYRFGIWWVPDGDGPRLRAATLGECTEEILRLRQAMEGAR